MLFPCWMFPASYVEFFFSELPHLVVLAFHRILLCLLSCLNHSGSSWGHSREYSSTTSGESSPPQTLFAQFAICSFPERSLPDNPPGRILPKLLSVSEEFAAPEVREQPTPK